MSFQICHVIFKVYVSLSLSVHVSALYSIGCSTSAPRIHGCFCGLAQFLGVPHIPQRQLSSPRQTNSPFHILVRPLLCADLPSQIHKVLRLLQFLSFHLQAKISCFPLPKIGILFSVCLSSCPFFGSPVRLLSASSVIPFPDIIRKSHIFYPFTSDVSPLRLIHPMPLP